MACTRGMGDKCYTRHVLRKQLGHGGRLPCDGREGGAERARRPGCGRKGAAKKDGDVPHLT